MSTAIAVERYHDISCGHRVAGHESKCAHLHGHNYRITFICGSKLLDPLGRVIDFSVVKEKLCWWTETHWDHKTLIWDDDVLFREVFQVAPGRVSMDASRMFQNSVVWVPFNPTAENMALYLLENVGPTQLHGTGVELVGVRVEETRKCSAYVEKE